MSFGATDVMSTGSDISGRINYLIIDMAITAAPCASVSVSILADFHRQSGQPDNVMDLSNCPQRYQPKSGFCNRSLSPGHLGYRRPH
jgi:hypothetical protein